jgi:multiple sugar transport system permease protein
MMQGTILVALLFRSLDAFRIYDTVYVQTRGANDTETVSILGYNLLIQRLNIGVGSAVSMCIFIVAMLIASIFVFGLRRAQTARGEA